MMGLAEPVAIAAHDAGAANIILAWVAAEGLGGCRAVMAGPAAALWRARFGEAGLVANLEEAMAGAAALVSGTGWASDLEHEARRLARARGVWSVGVIDHWVNYRQRFERGGELALPDVIWVTDEHALEKARREIPEAPLEMKPNLYLAEQVAGAGPRPENGDLLFVSEPTRDNWGRGALGEFQALDYLVALRDAATIPPAVRLRIRPHPSETPDKFDAWIAAHPGSQLDRSADMAEALRGAGWVAGLQSVALVIADAAGRTAISALPPGAPECPLPHRGLMHLKNIASRVE
jgi:hypothetical protein